MTVLQLHRRAMDLADIADGLARKGDHARAARFYGYAARRELKAAALSGGVQPSYRILMRSAASLIGSVVEMMGE